MTAAAPFPAEGGCACGAVRYRMASAPLFVHACHCRWCQRESGAAFALNAMIEADRVTALGQPPEMTPTPSESGQGQQVARCPHCRVAVWSHYAGAGPLVSFVRVGTLDAPDRLPPDIHIFTASRQPWLVLPPGTPAVAAYYEREDHWPPDSLARRAALLPRIAAYQAQQASGADAPRPPVVPAPAATFRTGRHLPASPAAVFAALQSAERLARWWGPAGFSNRFEVFDFQPGGRWCHTMVGPDGQAYPNESVFTAIEADRRVVIRHVNAPHFTLTITLQACVGGTWLGWVQAFDDPAVAQAVAAIVLPANDQNLDRLAAELARPSAGLQPGDTPAG
jgi:uncharacterized protein YndB with AHSA1/START domain